MSTTLKASSNVHSVGIWDAETPNDSLLNRDGVEPATSCPRRNVGLAERIASAVGGSALAAFGLGRGGVPGWLLGIAGGGLIYRGVTGHCHAYEALGVDTAHHKPTTTIPAKTGVKVERAVTITGPPDALYAEWRNFENLPRFMRHLKSVRNIDNVRSQWTAEGILGRDVEWEAELITDEPGAAIAWQSVPGGDVDTAGSVRFRPLAHDRGTEVTVSIQYRPPGGKVTDAVATLFGQDLESKIADDLRNFKRVIETGELPTTCGQPSGHR